MQGDEQPLEPFARRTADRPVGESQIGGGAGQEEEQRHVPRTEVFDEIGEALCCQGSALDVELLAELKMRAT